MILIVAALTGASEIIMASVFRGSTRKAVVKTTDRITRHNTSRVRVRSGGKRESVAVRSDE